MAWEVLEEFKDDFGGSRRTVVRVRCHCGVEDLRRKDHVVSGRTTSCKRCSTVITMRRHKKHGFLTHNRQYVGNLSRTLFSTYKHGALRRGIAFEISIEDAWAQFVVQGGICALTGREIILATDIKDHNPNYEKITASMDRIDSRRGYVEGNIQWVHKEINRFKNNYEQERFLDLCEEVTAWAKRRDRQ